MDNSKHIILGFAEAIAAPEVCFSLHDDGWSISAFTRNIRKCSLRYLPFVDLHEVPAPEDNAQKTMEALFKLVDVLKSDAIMPLDDTSLWLCSSMAENKFHKLNCKQIFAAPDAVAVALDKARQIEAARAAGFSVPATLVADTPSDANDWNVFPCIAKPALAVSTHHTGKEGFIRLDKGSASTFTNIAQLKNWIGDNLESGPFLIQPLIRGTGEGIFGHFHNGKVSGWSGHRRLRMMNPHGSGSSACMSQTVDAEIKPKVESFLHEIGWSGFFMVEMLRQDTETTWFMELNGRAWGSMALARHAGFNYPAWMVESKFGGIDFLAAIPKFKKCEARHIGRDIIHFLFVFKGPKNSFYREGWPGRFSTFLKVLKPHSLKQFYNYHPQYPAFFIRDGWMTLRNFFSRRRE